MLLVDLGNILYIQYVGMRIMRSAYNRACVITEKRKMIIDLTHTLKNNITVYPNTLEPVFEQGNTIEKDGFAEINMSMCTHTGTHIDAPAHIIPNTKSLDEFGVEKFIGLATVIDCSQIEKIDLDFLKEKKDTIRDIEFILFYTGWQHKWNSENYFDEFPTLTIEAAKMVN